MNYLVLALVLWSAGAWRIQENIIEFNVNENCPLGTELGTVASPSQAAMTELRYQLGSRSSLFAVDEKSGQLKTIAPIDAEALCARGWDEDSTQRDHDPKAPPNNPPALLVVDQVVCKTNGDISIQLDVNALLPDASLRAVHRVTIRVQDLNDNWPKFTQSKWHRKLKEMLYRKGRRIELPKAIDADLLTEYNQVKYHLEPLNTENTLKIPFRLEVDPPGQPGLVLTQDLDAEVENRYEFILAASSARPMWITEQLTGDKVNESHLLVVIEVIDMNDNEPRFEQNTFNVSVAEDTAVDTVIYQLVARDPDSTAQLTYSMGLSTESGLITSTFTIDPDGKVRLRSLLDFELTQTYKIQVKVSDGEFSAQAHLFVHVLDVNDEPPEFEINPQQLLADENAPVGKLIGRIRIRDPDGASVNGEVHCWEPSEYQGRQVLNFVPDPAKNPSALVYDLITRVSFDRESTDHTKPLLIQLICSDGWGDHSTVQNTATMSVTLLVRDENDHSPIFSQPIYHVTLAENNRIGDQIVQVNATDADEGENALITYTLLDKTNFKIDPQNGWITANVVFDRELRDVYQVTVVATDHGNPCLSASVLMNLTILDTNDHYPQLLDQDDWVSPQDQTMLPQTGRLTSSGNLFVVREHLPPYTRIGDIIAKDEDLGLNGRLMYAMLPNEQQPTEYASRFRILTNGSLYTTVELDREEKEQYELLISARDLSPTDSHTSTGMVRIFVLDVNDHTPVFIKPEGLRNSLSETTSKLDSIHHNMLYDQPRSTQSGLTHTNTKLEPTVHLSVHEKPGFVVTTLYAKDEDTGRNGRVTYALREFVPQEASLRQHPRSGPLIRVRADQGDVLVRRHMTVRDLGLHYFDISASDDGYPEPRLTEKMLVVLVEDKPAIGNPQTFHSSSYYSSNLTQPRFEFWLFEGRSNVFIITILASVSGLLAIVLITATVCVVRPPGEGRCCVRRRRAWLRGRPSTAPGSSQNGNGCTGVVESTNGRFIGFPAHGIQDHHDEMHFGTQDSALHALYTEDQHYTCGANGSAPTTLNYPGNNLTTQYLHQTNRPSGIGCMSKSLRISDEELNRTIVKQNRNVSVRFYAQQSVDEIDHCGSVNLPRSEQLQGVEIFTQQTPITERQNLHSFCVVKPIAMQGAFDPPQNDTHMRNSMNRTEDDLTSGMPLCGIRCSANATHLANEPAVIYPLGDENASDSGRGASEEEEHPNIGGEYRILLNSWSNPQVVRPLESMSISANYPRR